MDDQDAWKSHRLGSREASREPVRLMVQTRNGQHRREAEALDLSQTGVRLKTLSPLRPGSVHWLKIANLEPLEVTVIWSEGFYSGCRFTRPLHPAVYASLLANLGKA